MGNDEFVKLAKKFVNDFYLNRLDPDKDIYVVWLVKDLQNNKALLSTTVDDGKYYEVTHNGDLGVIYVDPYRKEEQRIYNAAGGIYESGR